MFAITPDSVFKVNTHAYTAVATSSTACALGIACDVWFLLRYNWVDMETFIVRTILALLTTHTLMTADDIQLAHYSTVLVIFTTHSSSSPCPRASPLSACCCPPSPS